MYTLLINLVSVIGALALVGAIYCAWVLVQHARAYWSPEQVDNRLTVMTEAMSCWMEAEQERRAMGESPLAFYGVRALVRRRLHSWQTNLLWKVFRHQNRQQAKVVLFQDDVTDPLHLKDDSAPCSWCRAEWYGNPWGTRTMDHTEGCFYVAWSDQQAKERDEEESFW